MCRFLFLVEHSLIEQVQWSLISWCLVRISRADRLWSTTIWPWTRTRSCARRGKMEMFAMNSDDLTHMGWGAWGWIINESWKDVEHWQNIWSVIHWPIRCAGAAGVWTNHQVHQFSTFFDGRAAGRPTTTLQILGRPKRLVWTAPELPGFASSLWLNYRLIGL